MSMAIISTAHVAFSHPFISSLIFTRVTSQTAAEKFRVRLLVSKRKKEFEKMASSKYEYVKSFELDDEVMLPNLMLVRIDGRDFSRFSQVHEFETPNDETALNLMNSCSAAVLEEFPDIIFAYVIFAYVRLYI